MVRTYLYRFTFAVALFELVACDNDPGKNKVAATVATAAATQSLKASEMATSAKYMFSGGDSKMGFVGAKITEKHEGSLGAFSGVVMVPQTGLTSATINAEVDVTSIAVEPSKLAEHLKSKDFFDVATFPKAKFTSTKIMQSGGSPNSYTVTGNLELHGVVKSISFPATMTATADAATADAEFVINRKDFGVVYPGRPDDLIKDEVLIKLTIRAKKA